MLLWLLERLAATQPELAGSLVSLGKTTFRASAAALISFALALLLGPKLIRWLKARFREDVQSDSPALASLQQAKQWTPTMGGLFLIAGLVAGVLALGNLNSSYTLVALWVAVGLATVGAVDDLTKLRGRRNGISARAKLAGQTFVALVAAYFLYRHLQHTPGGLDFNVSLLGIRFHLGWWFIPWAGLVIVGSSNAVNLTDGLDGLAGGCLMFACGAMGLVAYASGHAELAQYLNLLRLPGSNELLVLAGAMAGGILGFLWFNCHPAQVFMGDTGSLPLGGLLGLLAVATRQELLLLLVGGVFVVEALSVIVQVGWFRWTGRRVLLCAPLHHHFQFKGWAESKIVVRFWIASALCAIMGLASLKLQIQERPTENRSLQVRTPAAAEFASPQSQKLRNE